MKKYSGCFVVSLKGHDTGVTYLVTEEDENYVFLVNGKERKVCSPKKKKKKHVKMSFSNKISEYISEDTPITDGRLRRVIRQILETKETLDGDCREEE